MPILQIANVVVPQEFTDYQIENSLVSTALFQSGVVEKNALIAAQLEAGAQSFNIPFWSDLSDTEADITSDDPTVSSTPQAISASKQVVRKSFLHASWSEMALASELSGDDALARIQSRVALSYFRRSARQLTCFSSAETSSPRNTLLGHAIGLLCGYAAFSLSVFLGHPSVMHSSVHLSTVLAAALSLSATGALMVLFKVSHPPDGATTLIVSLGIISQPKELVVIEIAVVLLAAQALFLNRLAGLHYPTAASTARLAATPAPERERHRAYLVPFERHE